MNNLPNTRRFRLKAWFKDRPLPAKEKSYFSQLITDEDKSFGEKAARRIEQVYGMPEGYLDIALDVDEAEVPIVKATGLINSTIQKNQIATLQHFVKVPELTEVGSMGPGENLSYEAEQIVDFLPISRNWIGSNLKCKPENLRVVTGAGDSMAPTFNDGDLLLVDTSKKSIDVDGVYAMSAHQRLFIKRVRQRMDGSFEVSSDNPTVKTVDILNGDHEVTVHGRVVWAWNGNKL